VTDQCSTRASPAAIKPATVWCCHPTSSDISALIDPAGPTLIQALRLQAGVEVAQIGRGRCLRTVAD
jgi:hypothetical protein